MELGYYLTISQPIYLRQFNCVKYFSRAKIFRVTYLLSICLFLVPIFKRETKPNYQWSYKIVASLEKTSVVSVDFLVDDVSTTATWYS